MEFLYRVDNETGLVVELMDIRDELNAILTVLEQQRQVLGALQELYQSPHHPLHVMRDPEPITQSSFSEKATAAATATTTSEAEGNIDSPAILPVEGPMLQNQDQMQETLQIVEKNISAVHDLLAYAEQVQRSVENLLNFKQMHTNTWEARLRRERAEGAERSENVRDKKYVRAIDGCRSGTN